MSFTAIEKNVPVPLRDAAIVEALQKLEVGDSFIAQPVNQSFRNRLYVQATKLGIKVTSRVVSPTSLRIWRIEGGAA